MSADFVAHIEDVLDLYADPYDPARPLVCFDESSPQLLSDITKPLPAEFGRPKRQDYEYVGGGNRKLFLACEPRAGWRHVAITRQRTMQDFAHQMRWLVDQAYPDVPVARVVLDNLNMHRTASLYETFPPEEARRIAQRLEFPYTPKHWNWLNMAEMGSASWPGLACRDATATRTAWSQASTPTCRCATPRRPPSTGDLPPERPEPNSVGYILTLLF